jgi:hypothetical protein
MTAAALEPAYDVTWNVVGGGGQPISSAHYVVRSTVGQPAASPPYASSGAFVVSGGYWFGSAAAEAEYNVYLPIVMRVSTSVP